MQEWERHFTETGGEGKTMDQIALEYLADAWDGESKVPVDIGTNFEDYMEYDEETFGSCAAAEGISSDEEEFLQRVLRVHRPAHYDSSSGSEEESFTDIPWEAPIAIEKPSYLRELRTRCSSLSTSPALLEAQQRLAFVFCCSNWASCDILQMGIDQDNDSIYYFYGSDVERTAAIRHEKLDTSTSNPGWFREETRKPPSLDLHLEDMPPLRSDFEGIEAFRIARDAWFQRRTGTALGGTVKEQTKLFNTACRNYRADGRMGETNSMRKTKRENRMGKRVRQ